MAEFTGERLIPGQVDVDLLNEHLARYAFAARLAHGKRVLDAGCGAGYGSAELAGQADSVTGADLAAEAVDFARAHYGVPNLAFEQASCDRLPHPDACFDLVVAFEVIEHLEGWREFLLEARRVLAPGGQLIVSTPNKLYYTESRGAHGLNPFHVHEFDFEGFRGALESVFPHVALFLENHVEGVTFQPYQTGHTVETRVDAGDPRPDDSHFFVAVCAHRPQVGNPTFVYVPRAANVLRERERHIALLDGELAKKNQWLEKAQQDLAEFELQQRKLLGELEQSNQWASALNRELEERRARVDELQQELARAQENAQAQILELERELARERADAQAQLAREQANAQAQILELERELARAQENAQAQISRLEQELAQKIEWARNIDASLEKEIAEKKHAVDLLHETEAELADRTAWAQRLDRELARVSGQLTLYQASRWVKLGKKVGLGPETPAS
ncbi:MAG: methyltransferase domain-containing protein [Bryobacteraceae bacterium]